MTQPDLHATRQALRLGQTQAQTLAIEQAERSLALAGSPACERVFAQLTPEVLRQAAADPANAQRPLAGLSEIGRAHV